MEHLLENLWAKTGKMDDTRWHPLILHLLDVAAAADAVLMREPESTRLRMAECLGLAWEDARKWLLILIASHDLGKACPGFQCKWPGALPNGLKTRRGPNTNINHGFVSRIALTRILKEDGWADMLAEQAAEAVGCHHGARPPANVLDHLEGDTRAIGESDWSQARRDIFDALRSVFGPSKAPAKPELSGPDFMLLAGLTSFVDWIGSNEDFFPFGTPEACRDLNAWFQGRGALADRALDAIGWEYRIPLSLKSKSFQETFGLIPRPLQAAVCEVLNALDGPAVLLLEAPMGEGKTEAAYYAHLEMQRRFGHRGMYIALPTHATGNAMFLRTLDFLKKQGVQRGLDLQLVHGAALLNDTFQNLRLSGVHDETGGADIRAAEWFTNKRRPLLSEYGVGTVDQAILPILPVKHNFVRLWGLANRVLIFDEIHAYDAYTGTLLVHLLRWLLALGSSVVLLSATLPPSIRRRLAEIASAALPETEVAYPRISVFRPAKEVSQLHFEPDAKRRLTVKIEPVSHDPSSMRTAVEERLPKGGMALVLVNTVQRAQELYGLFPAGQPLEQASHCIGKRLADGTEIILFHARFPADRRQVREDAVLRAFGPKGKREGRKILVATQVAEQSLDLDFDVIATDLAPIDLILQRAGRLWRHPGRNRPIAEPVLLIAGLDPEVPPSFAEPLWWGKIYREDLLLRTWCLLRSKTELAFPDEIDALVDAVYEERVEVPAFLQKRMDHALMAGEKEATGKRGLANQAIIGLPDDASWDDPPGFTLYDEDQSGVHRTLLAKTRLTQDSVTVIPLWKEDGFLPEVTPEFVCAKRWFLRAVNLSRISVTKTIQATGVPEGWKKSPLLRNSFPLELDGRNRWLKDFSVRLDDELGVVYESKENVK